MAKIKKPTANSFDGRIANEGFILVAVLWILGALSAFAAIYAVYVINTAASFPPYDDRLRAEALVSAAIELVAYRQLSTQPQSRPVRGRFNFRLGRANILVGFRSENSRVDLNLAPKEVLVGLFQALGAARRAAEHYGDQIIAWRTPVKKSANQLTATANSAPGPTFQHANELALVPDLPEQLVERALPFVTVYSGRPQINVLDAAPEVIASLPAMTPEQLDAILAQRGATPENAHAIFELLKDSQQYATTEGSNAIRVNVAITFDGGRSEAAEVVILVLEQGDQPFSILSWSEDKNESTANHRRRVFLQ